MTALVCVIVVASLLVLATPSNAQRQDRDYNTYDCNNGPSDQLIGIDCNSYYQCVPSGDGTNRAVAVVQTCGGLVFNRDLGQCDYPINVRDCEDAQPNIKQEFQGLCNRRNRGNANAGESFNVAHPRFCNGFFSCGNGMIYGRCQFCGEGTYFDENSGFCVLLGGSRRQDVCGRRRDFVEPEDLTTTQESNDCWIKTSPNPWSRRNSDSRSGYYRDSYNQDNRGYNSNDRYNQGTYYSNDRNNRGTYYSDDENNRGTYYSNNGNNRGTYYSDDGNNGGTYYSNNGNNRGTYYSNDGNNRGTYYSNDGNDQGTYSSNDGNNGGTYYSNDGNNRGTYYTNDGNNRGNRGNGGSYNQNNRYNRDYDNQNY